MPGSVHYEDMIKYKVAERRKRLQRGLPVRPQRTNKLRRSFILRAFRLALQVNLHFS